MPNNLTTLSRATEKCENLSVMQAAPRAQRPLQQNIVNSTGVLAIVLLVCS
jgi:hypothetical protein